MHQPEWQVRTHLLSAHSAARCDLCLEKVCYLTLHLKLSSSVSWDICSSTRQDCTGVGARSFCGCEENFPLAHLTGLHPADRPSESCMSAASLMLPRWGKDGRIFFKEVGEEGHMSRRDKRTETWAVQGNCTMAGVRRGEKMRPLLFFLLAFSGCEAGDLQTHSSGRWLFKSSHSGQARSLWPVDAFDVSIFKEA